MKKKFYIVTLSLLALFVLLNVFIPNNLILQILGAIDLVAISVFAIAKEKSLYKVLTIVILMTMVLSYIIPGTTMNYGTVEKGTIIPVPFADVFTNGITSLSAFLTTFIYVLFIGVFYAVIKKTNKYEALVNNTAVSFNKNKGMFIVLTIFVLGLMTMFTGEIYAMLVFVPFLISVIRKLGYDKPTSIVSTIGSIFLGNAGSLYTYYSNQMLSLTVNDNVLVKVIITLVGLVSLVAFILVFGNKPEKTKDLVKSKENKMLPIIVTFIVLFVILVLGFVNWAGFFKFNGFTEFLETLRKGTVGKVSIFNALVGQSVVAFGNWQPYHASVLFLFVALIISVIYRIKTDDIFEAAKTGLKKAFPYAVIVILANLVLVNVYSSGIFYTIVVGLTKKTITLYNTAITSIIAAIGFPDYAYSTQFTITGIMGTKATNYQQLFAVVFQAVYSVFLLVSPTSILLLFGLKYTDTKYKDWIKYIYKYFIVLFITILVVISVIMKGFDVFSIVALILLVTALALIIYLKYTKLADEKIKEVSKEVVKKAPEVKETVKKTTTKTTNKKNTKNKK